MATVTSHRVAESRVDEFIVKGFRRRDIFPHRLYHVPKCGPDGFKVAGRMAGDHELAHQWQVLLFADGAALDELPHDLFFDKDVVWHEQHLGRPGQVASATVLVDGAVATSMIHHADLVQRIARVPELRTRVDNRFKGWPTMLFNGVAAFASARGARSLRTPTADLALAHTDPDRSVGRPLFDRVYDRTAERMGATRQGDWWVLDLDRPPSRIVVPDRVTEHIADETVVCVAHDLERGHGHRDVDARFAAESDAFADERLVDILAVEATAGVRATYNVVGCFLDDVRGALDAGRHCIAFHSFDHGIESTPGAVADQLGACRAVDYRLKGYRPPRSIITSECRDDQLAFHNFEWLANSAYASGRSRPELVDRIVRLPVSIDDFALHTGELDYDGWERDVLALASSQPYTCVTLHDCYAPQWLDRYEQLLERLAGLGRLRTLDEVAADVFLGAAA